MLLKISRAYFNVPYLLLALVALLVIGAGLNLKHFAFDASADTLIAENDPALAYFEEVSESFGEESFLFVTYQPTNDAVLSQASLQRLAELQTRFEGIEGISSVTSILDVPLLRSPPIDLTKMATDFTTLRSPDVDLELAKVELIESPLYQELLISLDGNTTALRLNLESNQSLEALREEFQDLRAVEQKTDEQTAEYAVLEARYQSARRAYVADQERLMSEIREVRDSVASEASVYLAGVPMVASDMIRLVKSDVRTFGGVCLIVIMLILLVFFRQVHWVLLPIATALLGVFVTSGILGLLRQPVTVISSNFVALLIIFSISFTVHLMVRYRELVREVGEFEPKEILSMTMIDKFAPCLYTALTTIVAFASLTVSGIVPVEDLGWIMCIAMIVSFVMNYTFFPAILRIISPSQVLPLPSNQPIPTRIMRQLSLNFPIIVILVALVGIVASGFGITRLSTEGRFIDYFRDRSEIKQGLVYVDENLGGTTPMDIILGFEPFKEEPLDEDDDFFAGEPDAFPERYWYTPDKIQKLRLMHEFLEKQPEVGKIISLATLEEVARSFNKGEALGSVELAGVIGAVPDDLRREFLRPYSSPESGTLRISLRMRETAPRHSRDALIQDIQNYAVEEVGFADGAVNVTGMNVLFNNMLKTLYQSQISTFGLVVLATFIMLLILLRSGTLAFIGIIPNLISAMLVLGFMGFMGITLDMMTMTIAAIIIGIGVDNAIHFLHRFKLEFSKGLTAKQSIEVSYNSIGYALYFTAITVIAGFSVLSLSNFLPTVYFGLLTAMAMAVSLLANLLVLPSLLMLFFNRNALQESDR